MKLSTVEKTGQKASELVPEKREDNSPKGHFNKLVEKAKRNGISRPTLNSRLYKYGWSEERATTEPVGSSKRGGRRIPKNPGTGPRKGEEVPTAKLTTELVLKMREEYIPKDRERGTRALARKYKVSQATVLRAVTGKSWSHLTMKDTGHEEEEERSHD